MMNSAQKRKGRGNSSSGNRGGRRGFEYQRSFEQPRNYESQKSYEQRNYGMEKNIEKPPIMSGVFSNPRFTNVVTSLVGCVVQLQVKNGGRYEGIFKTCNPQMDVVLEMAHKCDDSGNNNHNSVASMPSKDRLIDKVIFHFSDILTIDALNVELDYAVKDTFTDAAISKSNGQVLERDLRELQPWDGEGGEELGAALNADSSNGWDADEMFRRNAEQFNVQSTYDDSLKQYTIPLQKRDTKEYKEREERAAKIANEIEKTEQYRQRVALENGEEETEEDKYSAVKRNNDNNSQVNMQTSGKYIPPMRRNQQTRNVRGGNIVNHNVPNKGPVSPVHSHPPPTTPPTQSTQQSHIPPSIEESKFSNGNSVPDVKRTEAVHTSSSSSSSSSSKPSPVVVEQQINTINENKSETLQTSPLSSKIDRRNSNPKARDVVVQELKDFSTKFKLDEETKEKESKEKDEKVIDSSAEIIEKVQTEDQKPVEDHTSQEQQTETESEKDLPEYVKNSILNPMAKEFNPTAKPFTPKQPPPVPTPPRPQTQSPIIQTLPPAGYYTQQYMVPPNVVSMPTQQVPTSQPHNRHPKRAVVSVHHTPRPDLTAAAAQAATGQPLLAQASVQQPYMYTFPMVPQPTGYQVGQVMPMPAATPNGPRMVNPNMVPTSHQSNVDHSNQSHSGHIFMAPPGGPVPAHLPNQHHQQQYSHPQPAHMGAPHTNQHQQHQQHQQQQQQPHPAPSPVQQQHTGSNTQSHTQAPPPPSGTPQPQHVPYQQINIQGQPPLQPSPHNPTSPQTMHPISMPYHFQMAAHNQQGNQQHFNNMNQQNPPPTTVGGHTLHSQHMQHHQPHLVMMPQPNPNQVQQQQHSHQFQGHHMTGQGNVHGQSHMLAQPGALQTNNPNSIHPHQMHHFVPPGMAAALNRL